MDCRFSSEDLSAFADGELDAIRSRSIAEHLRVCRHCRTQVEALSQVSSLLGRTAVVDVAPRVQAGVARRIAMCDDSPRFTCACAQVWMSSSLDGELTARQLDILHEHLDLCPACAAESEALATLSTAVRALPELDAPISLERCIRTAIARERRGWLPQWIAEGFWRPRLAPGLATAMAAATLFAGFYLGRLTPGGSIAHAPLPAPALRGTKQSPEVFVATNASRIEKSEPSPEDAKQAEQRRRQRELAGFLRSIADAAKPVVAKLPELPIPGAPRPHREVPREPVVAPIPVVPAPVVADHQPAPAPTPEAPVAPAPAPIAENPPPALPRSTEVAVRPPDPTPSDIDAPPIRLPQRKISRSDAEWAKLKEDLNGESAAVLGSRPQSRAMCVTIFRAPIK